MKMSTSRKMLAGIIGLVFFETIILTCFFMVNMNSQTTRHTEQSMHEVLTSNVRLLDTVMEDIVDRAERICVDSSMHELLLTLNSSNVSRKMAWSDSMKKIVFNFFGSMANDYENYIRDINIFSPDFTYSDRNLFTYEYEKFMESDLHTDALETAPYYYWVPTADTKDHLSTRMRSFIQGTSSNVDTEVIRLVKRMNVSMVEGDFIHKLSGEIPHPYIVISLEPDLMRDTFSTEGLTKNSSYLIVTAEGQIVCSEDSARNGEPLEVDGLLEAVAAQNSPYYSGIHEVDGEPTLVGVVRSESSDWYYMCLVPQSDVNEAMNRSAQMYICLTVSVLAVTLLISGYFVRETTRPVRELAQKADLIATVKVGVPPSDSPRETDRIMTVLESLNEQIERLTVDNVELERREREANILMLEMQINPHFLYNSLNKLHIGLLKSGEEEIAGQVIALSRALRYSVDAREHLVYLHRDIEQLKLYLTVVQSAQENRFAVYYDIENELYNSIVPKMLLQPFVENAIIHGFKNATFGCLIHIQGALQEDGTVLYTVTDNGAGIHEEKKDLLLSGVGGHIGCSNVHKRIQLLFGEEYGVSVGEVAVGTKICIRLPCIYEK